jgi:hypothetical protein
MPVVYKITYPNARFTSECDMTDDVRYFGSANPNLVAANLPPEQRADFTLTEADPLVEHHGLL